MFSYYYPIGATYADGYSYRIPWELETYFTEGSGWETSARRLRNIEAIGYKTTAETPPGALGNYYITALISLRKSQTSDPVYTAAFESWKDQVHSPLWSVEDAKWKYHSFVPYGNFEFYDQYDVENMMMTPLDKTGLVQTIMPYAGEFVIFPTYSRTYQAMPAVFKNGTNIDAPPSNNSNYLTYLPGSDRKLRSSQLGGPFNYTDQNIAHEGYIFSNTTLKTSVEGIQASVTIVVNVFNELESITIIDPGAGYSVTSSSIVAIYNDSDVFFPEGVGTFDDGQLISVSFTAGQLDSVTPGTYYVAFTDSPGGVYTEHIDSPTGPGASGVIGICCGLCEDSISPDDNYTPSPFEFLKNEIYYNLPTHKVVLGNDGFETVQLSGAICPEVVLGIGYDIQYGYPGPAFSALKGSGPFPTDAVTFTNGAVTPVYDRWGAEINGPTKSRAVVSRCFVWGDLIEADIISRYPKINAALTYKIYRCELRDIAYKTFTYGTPSAFEQDWQIYSEKPQGKTWCLVEDLGEIETSNTYVQLSDPEIPPFDGEFGIYMPFKGSFTSIPTIPAGTLVCIAAEYDTLYGGSYYDFWDYDYWRFQFEPTPPPWKMTGVPSTTYPNGFIYLP